MKDEWQKNTWSNDQAMLGTEEQLLFSIKEECWFYLDAFKGHLTEKENFKIEGVNTLTSNLNI
jgi:hypothetical protein